MNTEALRRTLDSSLPTSPTHGRRSSVVWCARTRMRLAGAIARAVAALATGDRHTVGARGPRATHRAAGRGTCTIPVTLASPPSGSPTGQGYERDPAAVAVATRQLVAYLHVVHRGGAAAFVYLDPQWRGDPPAVVGDPRLISGARGIYAMTPTTDGYTGVRRPDPALLGDAQAWRTASTPGSSPAEGGRVPGDYAINLNTGPETGLDVWS